MAKAILLIFLFFALDLSQDIQKENAEKIEIESKGSPSNDEGSATQNNEKMKLENNAEDQQKLNTIEGRNEAIEQFQGDRKENTQEIYEKVETQEKTNPTHIEAPSQSVVSETVPISESENQLNEIESMSANQDKGTKFESSETETKNSQDKQGVSKKTQNNKQKFVDKKKGKKNDLESTTEKTLNFTQKDSLSDLSKNEDELNSSSPRISTSDESQNHNTETIDSHYNESQHHDSKIHEKQGIETQSLDIGSNVSQIKDSQDAETRPLEHDFTDTEGKKTGTEEIENIETSETPIKKEQISDTKSINPDNKNIDLVDSQHSYLKKNNLNVFDDVLDEHCLHSYNYSEKHHSRCGHHNPDETQAQLEKIASQDQRESPQRDENSFKNSQSQSLDKKPPNDLDEQSQESRSNDLQTPQNLNKNSDKLNSELGSQYTQLEEGSSIDNSQKIPHSDNLASQPLEGTSKDESTDFTENNQIQSETIEKVKSEDPESSSFSQGNSPESLNSIWTSLVEIKIVPDQLKNSSIVITCLEVHQELLNKLISFLSDNLENQQKRAYFYIGAFLLIFIFISSVLFQNKTKYKVYYRKDSDFVKAVIKNIDEEAENTKKKISDFGVEKKIESEEEKALREIFETLNTISELENDFQVQVIDAHQGIWKMIEDRDRPLSPPRQISIPIPLD